MIEIKATGICERCPYAELEMVSAYGISADEFFNGVMMEHCIRCTHEDICNRLVKYFEQKLANNSNPLCDKVTS